MLTSSQNQLGTLTLTDDLMQPQYRFRFLLDDAISGTAGGDRLDGTEGNDTIQGLAGNDRLAGLAGDDTLLGGDGNDRLLGGTGNDRISGGRGDDVLLGGSGLDTLVGGTGADVLFGGAGNDVLVGGVGRDTFVMELATGRDRIQDFEDGIDRIAIPVVLEFSDLAFVSAGNNAQIWANNRILAVVAGVSISQLQINDFVCACTVT